MCDFSLLMNYNILKIVVHVLMNFLIYKANTLLGTNRSLIMFAESLEEFK